MSTEPNGEPSQGAPQPKEQSSKSIQPPKGEKTGTAETPNALSGEKKLSGAELKKKAKEEKAAKRALAKASKEVAKGEAAVSSSPGQLGPSAGEVKGNKKGKQDATATAGSGAGGRPTPNRATPSMVAEQKATIPECFSHLPMAKRLPMTQADKSVHPAVLALGQQMATFTIDESINRLRATLLAFKRVIASYSTPAGHTLARHFTPHVLGPQIDYLTSCRPMCFSMGNAIRWLKLQISKIDMDSKEEDAKRDLCRAIDNFITERITAADEVITESGAKHIENGDVVLVYGRSSLVERTLLCAYSFGTNFSVFVIDDPYERAGQLLAKTLAAEGIKVTYCGDFGGLINHMRHATKVLFAADAMFSNGAMYARAGACDVALAANELEKEVITLCETINITERVATDSLTYNEIDPERCSAEAFRLLFDTTPVKYLNALITELGCVASKSAPILLRKLEEFN
ncbi:uncharacterized protein BCR38DRAFT_330481 [Pseudomassariella vexata]|uniref:Translation initiation factor eIF2B subunit delta n=1 Tax=Pseudomassariella vexata TaxID=1141098 RepID=A0A1Y2EK81_9PEZI|nr:uncharacterized protein BCR38DRAFT_330481 [Pseudomassariella vexata]ORY71948.1 hypothetical protein BCR38DRAFT_330481 [Pseudomassariella vexata]